MVVGVFNQRKAHSLCWTDADTCIPSGNNTSPTHNCHVPQSVMFNFLSDVNRLTEV